MHVVNVTSDCKFPPSFDYKVKGSSTKEAILNISGMFYVQLFIKDLSNAHSGKMLLRRSIENKKNMLISGQVRIIKG